MCIPFCHHKRNSPIQSHWVVKFVLKNVSVIKAIGIAIPLKNAIMIVVLIIISKIIF